MSTKEQAKKAKLVSLLEKYPSNEIAGVDEAGRGPLAGEVVAAAVILPVDHGIEGLADSKKLSEARRETLFDQIQEAAIAYSLGAASVQEIDEHNILQATMLAMHRAVDGLAVKQKIVLVDGNRTPKWSYSSEAIVGGDALVESISAASILAKVTRDRSMVALAEQYPDYGFEKHKGYGTAAHLQALEQFGALDAHRRSFAPVKRALSAQPELAG